MSEPDDTKKTNDADAVSPVSSGKRKQVLLGIGGAIGSAAVAAALLYVGRSRKKDTDKLGAARSTPPTD